MAEQTFRSPGFFEREIDLSERQQEIVGVPAGVIGTSEMGPAFIPVTVGSLNDFVNKFGSVDRDFFAPYAVNEWLKNRTALTFCRVLGAGANETSTDINATVTQGTVKNAGFRLVGTTVNSEAGAGRENRHAGVVQFIAASHNVMAQEAYGYPQFSNNDSFVNMGTSTARLVRAVLMTPTGSRFQVMHFDKFYSDVRADRRHGDVAIPGFKSESDPLYKKFKLVLSSSANDSGTHKFNDENHVGIKIYTASLDPSDDAYVGKILNTDPNRFQEEEHLLYADFAVEDEVATLQVPATTAVNPNITGSVALVSGSANTWGSGPTTDTFRDLFGRFDTRYRAPKTTPFISQPYGTREYDLFHFETIADGANASDKFKISITDLRKSTNPQDKYGTFTVLVRSFGDSDTSPEILEQYPLCTLNPNDDDFVARKIGDLKVVFDFDAESEKERRFVITGKYANVSSRIRIVLSTDMNRGEVPIDALPFGFRGLPLLKTNDTMTDGATALTNRGKTYGQTINARTATVPSGSAAAETATAHLSQSLVPPVPLRYKVTKGATSTNGFPGNPGTTELVDNRYYWGINVLRVPKTASLSNAILNPNAGGEVNPLVRSYTKLLGIEKLGTLVTGSGRDVFQNNKFSLSQVCLSVDRNPRNTSDYPIKSLVATVHTYLTGTAKEHMLETVYVRNGQPDSTNGYTVDDRSNGGNGKSHRVTMASLYSALTSSVYFNKFTDYLKFTNIFHGGFDGTNILDPDMAALNDRSSSTALAGKAAGTLDIGISSDGTSTGATSAWPAGTGRYNNTIFSYRTAIDIMTDPFVVRTNILCVPGIRDPFVTDHAADKTKKYSKAIYLMDIPAYDKDQVRIYDGQSKRPDVTKTREVFDSRAVDSNYSATYFPDVTILDDINDSRVQVPASIAALAALGFNDSVSYPWFAPAGFNRAALSMVTNTDTRLTSLDRDDLYDSRINPIASFPGAGYVIFGQKTLQQAKSALDRVNVRRMLLEVKRLVVDVSNKLLFEQNTPALRAKFVSQIAPLLALVQSQQGIDKFSVICDDTNNSQEDIESNKLNGRIVLVPTRAVEFISIDFIITNAGVSFE
jgi:hypothetical protein